MSRPTTSSGCARSRPDCASRCSACTTSSAEEFLPSAKTMIVSIVTIILVLMMFTNLEGHVESLVTLGFLSFFFLYLLRLLMIIDKPFEVGAERTDDDVSLFLLNEFVIHADVAGTGAVQAEACRRPGRGAGGVDGRGRAPGRRGRGGP